MAAGERRSTSDTIAAIATPTGRGAIGIVRLSGPRAGEIAQTVTGVAIRPRHAHYLSFRDSGGEIIDRGITLLFPGPNSFTGEDVVEFQTHGSPAVLDSLLGTVIKLGARPARPGEFTERAFLNGRMDLAQAEAVADLIGSASDQVARAALGSLQGEFSRQVNALIGCIDAMRAEIEARLDFPDDAEEESFGDTVVGDIIDRLDDILRKARCGVVLREGIEVAIVGRPNAGKSSLLNRLAGRDRAIVSHLPGTTRDTVTAEVLLKGFPVSFTDTAGLRADADSIEQEGIRRTREVISGTDHVLLLVPYGDAILPEDEAVIQALPAGTRLTLVRSKIDLAGSPPSERPATDGQPYHEVGISSVSGEGLDILEQRILDAAGQLEAPEGAFSARRRHLEALAQARAAMTMAVPGLPPELFAENLRRARRHLEVITGAYTNEDLLDEIFASFCIGK